MRMLSYLAVFFFSTVAFSQTEDDVLFTVADDEIRVSEFRYIYEKNNAENADYTKESLKEYLELYTKFKLKVKRAKDLGLDTIQILQDELAGYRKQLAKSYLKDKEISEQLIDEVMERMQYDMEVQHIFVAAEPKSPLPRKEAARKKINNIYDKLVTNEGQGFEEMAKTLSEDKFSAVKGGKLGYYTAPLPDGFYEFENAMYNTPIGEFSKPVRSKMGYHILKVTDKRPARGEMEVAHILIRKKNKSLNQAKTLIDSVYHLLQEGRNYENMAGKFSEDFKSRPNGGYLGFFGINQYDKAFEDAAFALTEDQSYSEPVLTELGYHIIKRISKRDTSDKERMRKRIQARINNNDRFDIAEQKMIDDVKEQAGFEEDLLMLKRFTSSLDENFYSYKWQPEQYDNTLILFNLAGNEIPLKEFAAYCKSNVRERLKFNKSKPVQEAAEELYTSFVNERVMKYEEANLEEKYPDFRALMREYREGILLFEITKQEVWDKAASDTSGLKKFFAENESNYMWPERVAVYKYSIDTDDRGAMAVYNFAQKKSHEEIIQKFSKSNQIKITTEELILDKNSELVNGMPLKENGVTNLVTLPKPANFIKYKGIVAPQQKSLSEAKGYVIADYQDHLEKQWVKKLENMYPVKINKKVLNSLVKK